MRVPRERHKEVVTCGNGLAVSGPMVVARAAFILAPMTDIDTGPSGAPQRHSALSPLHQPVFRAIWFASTLSNLGAIIQSVGASWMMLSIAHSPAMVALVQASVALPIVLLALVAGAVADNLD